MKKTIPVQEAVTACQGEGQSSGVPAARMTRLSGGVSVVTNL